MWTRKSERLWPWRCAERSDREPDLHFGLKIDGVYFDRVDEARRFGEDFTDLRVA
jgi:hypothetical protein